MTPMFLVIVALGTTDLLFALDSIPAIYGLTQEPYLVFTANVFALMGLRQLYFLLGDLLKRLVYLSQGLAFILAFIGVKLVLHALHENELPFINGGEPVHGARDPDAAQPRRHHRDARHHHRRQPVQDAGARQEEPSRTLSNRTLLNRTASPCSRKSGRNPTDAGRDAAPFGRWDEARRLNVLNVTSSID